MAVVRSSTFSAASAPACLIALRASLGPVLVVLAAANLPAAALIALLITAMLSDIFDGVLARRLGVVTAALRVADSRVDAWFFGCTAMAAWIAAPEAVLAHINLIAVSLFLQIASYAYDLARYRRIVCLHAYSAKAWGVSLYVALTDIIAFHSGSLVPLAFAIGLVSFFDAAAIKLILPGWRHDVLSTFHAIRARIPAASGATSSVRN